MSFTDTTFSALILTTNLYLTCICTSKSVELYPRLPYRYEELGLFIGSWVICYFTTGIKEFILVNGHMMLGYVFSIVCGRALWLVYRREVKGYDGAVAERTRLLAILNG